MGAGKSRMKHCSDGDFKNAETKNALSRTHNRQNSNEKDVHVKKAGLQDVSNNNDFNCVRRNVERPRSNKECSDGFACGNCDINSTSTRKYSLETLTPEQQLEEIQKVFQRKKREKAGEISAKVKRSHGPPKTRTTCCNCNCNCEKTKKLPQRFERRNGLQNLGPPGGKGCRCSMCNGRLEELSEAEAIANAIAEYCCRERKRTQRQGLTAKSRRCCQCNGELEVENNLRQQEIASDEEEQSDFEMELEVEPEESCCCTKHERGKGAQTRKSKCCKCEREDKLGKHKQLEEEDEVVEEELVEVEEVVEEEEIMEEQEVVEDEDYAVPPAKQSNRGQAHAKGCRCCECKKDDGSAELSDDEEEEFSVDDIELEIQEVSAEKTEISAPAAPQSKRQLVRSQSSENKTKSQSRTDGKNISPIPSHVKGCTCCDCKKQSEARGIIEEKEVLLKKIDLDGRREESVKVMREKPAAKDLPTKRPPNRDVYEDSKAKTQRSRSEGLPTVRPKSEDRANVEECKCCDCINGKPQAESWKSKMGSTGRREEKIKTLPEYEKHDRPGRTIEDEPQSRRNLRRGREEQRFGGSWEAGEARAPKRETKRDETTAVKDHQSSHRYDRKQWNPERYARRPRRGEASNEEVEEAAAAQQRWRSQKKVENEYNPEKLHGRSCSCCECKEKFSTMKKIKSEKSLVFEGEDTESEKQQSCCCFRRKKSQGKSAESERNSCCKCKKDRSAEKSKRSYKSKEQYERYEKQPEIEPATRKTHHDEKECKRECSCKKKKGVPLTKCCRCGDDEYESEFAISKERYREEHKRRRKLAEELADRLQHRAGLQIELQQRLQDQLKAKQKQRSCCDPPSCCFPQCPCCETRCEPIPMNCCESPTCCFPPPTPCCYPPPSCCFPQSCPPCCYEPPPCYGQECPCCCQPMPYCYAASCSYTKPGS